MKIVFAVDLDHDPVSGPAQNGSRVEPLQLSAFLGSGETVEPTARRSFHVFDSDEAVSFELWWIQGCCPVVTIECSNGLGLPAAKFHRVDLGSSIDQLLEHVGQRGRSGLELFPGVLGKATDTFGDAAHDAPAAEYWSGLLVVTVPAGSFAVAAGHVGPGEDQQFDLVILGLKANVSRLADGLRSWTEGPLGAD